MTPLLTALDCEGQVHLIIGSNPLASARCAKSVEVGAKPKIIARADADVHYVLAKRIEQGEVEWIKKDLDDEDLTTFGREEVDGVVDAVFVTSGGKSNLSMYLHRKIRDCNTHADCRHTHFATMSEEADTCQRRGCAQPLHFYSPIHSLRRAATDWNHNIWQGMQAGFTNKARDSLNATTRIWQCCRSPRHYEAPNMGRGP